MKVASVLSLCVGLTLASAAGTASAAPKSGHATKVPSISRAEPLRIRGVRLVGHQRVVATTPWHAYKGGATRGQPVYAFDAYESSTGHPGAPPGHDPNNTGGCDDPGTGYWYGGATYSDPFCANDMTVGAGFNNAQAKFADIAWYSNVSENFSYLLFTAETFDTSCAGPATSGDFDGVQYDFGTVPIGGFYANIDLTTDPTLFHQLPADGSGGYTIIMAQAVDPNTGDITLSTTAQPLLWGTGDNEVPPDSNRVGHQGAIEWDDDQPTDGTLTPGVECYDYTGFTPCPSLVGAVLGLGLPPVAPPACQADINGDGQVNVQDFLAYLALYAAADPRADIDGSGAVNVQDFLAYLALYAHGCP
jgi:hypothetical protein